MLRSNEGDCKVPVLEIGRALAARGHTVGFATLNGQEHWIDGK